MNLKPFAVKLARNGSATDEEMAKHAILLAGRFGAPVAFDYCDTTIVVNDSDFQSDVHRKLWNARQESINNRVQI